ncbi:DNA gyrase subunit B [Kineococcus aurantiacus]|uniref:DNA topoisomerase (ATP-hydrolyzing) n=1 Tax=Kineococcus aurantiacus TaxID=37633 RepID=A0A7Y9DPK9_9ACTN|nr:DNA gyrase subunit B [Kineococcus aurantiacus]
MTPPRSPSAGPAGAEDKYTAANLLVLEGLEAVRKRPGMYIGSTDSRGLMHCLWEIIDNSVDEALGGHCSSITVVLHADGSVEVHDDGRGIPVDVERRTGLSGVEVVFTHLHAGGKFGGGSYSASGGLHGVGASVVNALSSRLDVQVDRGGKTYATSFRRGAPGRYAGEGPDAPFTPATGLEVVGRAKRGVTGTRVRYWADTQVFLKDAKFSYEDLTARARQTSFLVPGLRIVLRDERSGEAVEEVFQHDGGIGEYADFLTPDAPVTSVWRLQGEDVFTETVPVLDDSGHMDMQDVERRCAVDVALRWGTGYDQTVRSFVNIIATPKGGSHLSGFEQGLFAAVKKQVDAQARRLKVGKDEKLEKDDILAGMTAVVTVRLAEPQFEGQTKEVLGTAAVRAIVRKVVENQLGEILTSPGRDQKAQATAVLDKVVTEMKSRISARLHKETQRRKNALESSSLPPKLKDCRSDDVTNTELFLVEGDSALGTAMGARDSEYQALLPLRGKILNVQKASVTDMLKNAECASIIQVVGGGSGRSFDLDAVRYGKVVLMTDADVDGAHIRTLLLTLFFRYMRPLIDAGRVFAAVPPLHRLEVTQAGKKGKEVVYTYSDAELRRVTADLARRGRTYREPQRYKGLGEMDEDQLAETTMERQHRTLRRVTVSDGAAAERVFELLMGNDVAPRKDFIIAGAEGIDRDRIDA